jgi:guanylate kinase
MRKEEVMIIALCGPSGIGKGYIKERLLITYPFLEELAWFTTRPLRPNERCSNRISIAILEFNRLVDAGQLVLVQDLYGHRYGLGREDLLPNRRARLTELHPDNILEALRINPSIIAVGLVTFNLSLLRKRLSILRDTGSITEIERRITSAEAEIETILRCKKLLAAVIEVSETSETLVFEQTLAVLLPHLIEKRGEV